MNPYSKLLLSIISYSVIACGSSGTGTSSLGVSPLLTENFSGTNNSIWPTGWATVSGAATISVDIQSNRGRLRSNSFNNINSNSALTRVYNNSVNAQDVDIIFTVIFDAFANQGVGFYARQNGGYLTDSATNGQGYAVFFEGFGTRDFGLWYEQNGVETRITGTSLPGFPTILDNTAYRIRFQVEQVNATDTTQRARVWLASDIEPATWSIETTTSFVNLQNISGGIAVDLFNYAGTGSIYFDDISVTQLN